MESFLHFLPPPVGDCQHPVMGRLSNGWVYNDSALSFQSAVYTVFVLFWEVPARFLPMCNDEVHLVVSHRIFSLSSSHLCSLPVLAPTSRATDLWNACVSVFLECLMIGRVQQGLFCVDLLHLAMCV